MANIKNVNLETERLLLRLPKMSDAHDLQPLIGAWEIAEATGEVPHPYNLDMAEDWIQRVSERPDDMPRLSYLIIRREDNQLLGGIGCNLNLDHEQASFGYWIGVPFWGNGYASEAAGRIIDYCFEAFPINRVQASYFTDNIASRRVMGKNNMTYEGTLRQSFIREIPSKNHRVVHDLGYCAILRSEWQANKG